MTQARLVVAALSGANALTVTAPGFAPRAIA